MDTLALQTRLRSLGFDPGPLDGAPGPRTAEAIKAFQRSRGLAADGIVGRATEAALAASAPAPPSGLASGLVYPSHADLALIFPSANTGILASYCDALPKVVAGCGVTTIARASHFIGQCGHESDHFKTREEYASGKAYEGRRDLGNVQPGDGVRFKGRAEIQLTGRSNYNRAAPYVRRVLNDPSIDLVANPTIIVQRADVSIAVDCWFWNHGSQHYGDLNLQADKDDGTAGSFESTIETITHAINGGSNGLDSRRQLTLAVKRVITRLNAH